MIKRISDLIHPKRKKKKKCTLQSYVFTSSGFTDKKSNLMNWNQKLVWDSHWGVFCVVFLLWLRKCSPVDQNLMLLGLWTLKDQEALLYEDSNLNKTSMMRTSLWTLRNSNIRESRTLRLYETPHSMLISQPRIDQIKVNFHLNPITTCVKELWYLDFERHKYNCLIS